MGVRQARAELPAVLRLAAEGQPVILTRHGKPAAVLLPIAAGELWQRHLDDLRAGLRRDPQGNAPGGSPASDTTGRGGATEETTAVRTTAQDVGHAPRRVGQGTTSVDERS